MVITILLSLPNTLPSDDKIYIRMTVHTPWLLENSLGNLTFMERMYLAHLGPREGVVRNDTWT
jgi:hypothetical protein